MPPMRDLPPISGAIIWARQIERQCLTYTERVEDVLGHGWELYAEGQKLDRHEACLHGIDRRDKGVDSWLLEISWRRVSS